MNENAKKNKREWVKTFAIIFLAVMLVLTFFSNTIMNMNLPEVSTSRIQYGSIKNQVRTSGVVTARGNYEITFPTTREIAGVNFRKGDYINKGDVIFSLVEGDSEELESARENYNNLKYEYDKAVINLSGSGDYSDTLRKYNELLEDYEEAKKKKENFAVQQGAIDSKEAEIAGIEADIKACEKEIRATQTKISQLEADKAAIGYTPTEYEVLVSRNENVTYEEYVNAVALIDSIDTELEEAQAVLDEAKGKLEVLEKSKSDIEREKKKYEDQIARLESDIADYPTKSSIEAKEKEIIQSDRNIEELERNLKYTKQEFYDTTVNRELERLYDKFKDKQSDYRKAKKKYEDLLNSSTATDEQIAKAKKEFQDAGDIVDDAYDEYQNCLTDEKNAAKIEEKALSEAETTLKYALEDNATLKEEFHEMKALYQKRLDVEEQIEKIKTGTATEKGMNEVEKQLVDIEEKIYTATGDVSKAEANVAEITRKKEKTEKTTDKTRNEYKYSKVKEYDGLIEEQRDILEGLEEKLTDLNDTLQQKNKELAKLKEEGFGSEEELDQHIKSLERQLDSEKANYEKAKENATDEEKLKQLELTRMKGQLDKAYVQLSRLEERLSVNEIKSPVSGIVDIINIQVGQKIQPDQSLAEISLSEMGFTMTATATPEQAARLRPGTKAEITSWIPYDSEVSVTLNAIKNDSANPGSRQKLLEFTIEGTGIEAGQNISVAVGDKNANYDNTVPNSSIFEDSTGKYILLVESKSTAISTRYIVKKVPVKVIASDDIRSAITGEFESYSYVVSSSAAPIKDGDQVKLNEN